jgi:hypothetical protein
MDENVISKDEFLKLIRIFSALQPYRSPDFSKMEVCWFWHQEFKRHSAQDLRNALSRFVRQHDHFPSIREMTTALAGGNDLETMARVTAMNILGAVPKYGWCNLKEAEAYIGKVGMQIVDRWGGWVSFCEIVDAKNYSFLQTQLYEMAKACMSYQNNENESKQLKSGEKVPELIQNLAKSMEIK